MDTFYFDDINNDSKKLEHICDLVLQNVIFLRQIDSNIQNINISYEYQYLINNLKISSSNKKITLITPNNNKINFNIISKSFNNNWKQLNKYLKHRILLIFYKNGITYDISKQIIKEYNIKTKVKYLNICKSDKRLTNNPKKKYTNEFTSWVDFLK